VRFDFMEECDVSGTDLCYTDDDISDKCNYHGVL